MKLLTKCTLNSLQKSYGNFLLLQFLIMMHLMDCKTNRLIILWWCKIYWYIQPLSASGECKSKLSNRWIILISATKAHFLLGSMGTPFTNSKTRSLATFTGNCAFQKSLHHWARQSFGCLCVGWSMFVLIFVLYHLMPSVLTLRNSFLSCFQWTQLAVWQGCFLSKFKFNMY